jgi:hypothetical protein
MPTLRKASNQDWTAVMDTDGGSSCSDAYFITQMAKKSLKAMKKSARNEIRSLSSKLDSLPAVICIKCNADQSQYKSGYRFPDINKVLDILAEICEEINSVQGRLDTKIDENKDNTVCTSCPLVFLQVIALPISSFSIPTQHIGRRRNRMPPRTACA